MAGADRRQVQGAGPGGPRALRRDHRADQGEPAAAESGLSGRPAGTIAAFEAAYRAHHRRRRARATALLAALGAAVVGAAVVAEVSPIAFLEGLPNALDYAGRTVPIVRAASPLADLAAWMWGLPKWLRLLGDTLIIAFVGTALATLVAVPASFVAARNLAPRPWLSMAARRTLELARGVPELVYALVFVFAFGLGALPGVLAVAVHSVGALGKLFAEAAEAVDAGPIDGVRATGAGWVQVMRFAVLPQVAPAYLSYALLRFEINVRAAAIVGFVGAGGIGMELYLVIRQFIYPDISALVLLLVATVAVIDVACERVRHRILGGAAA